MREINRYSAAATALVALALISGSAQTPSSSLGQFEGSTDVGEVLHAGSADYDATSKIYTLTGSGENMWFAKDDFHFVWKKVSAKDLSLTADISLLGSGGDNHRKGVLMIRQSLDTDAPYADAARHGDGLTSLQFRSAKGDVTHEVESNVSGPARLRLEKRGDIFYLWVGEAGKDLQFAGGSTRVRLQPPFYVGIGVCAHNKDAVQKAAFSNVDVSTSGSGSPARYSTLETIAVASTDARVAYVSKEKIGPPSWSPEGAFVIATVNGQSRQIPMQGGVPKALASGVGNNDGGSGRAKRPRPSPDEKESATLSKEQGDWVISVEKAGGNNRRTLARLPAGGSLGEKPWSPDGKRLAFLSYQSLK